MTEAIHNTTASEQRGSNRIAATQRFLAQLSLRYVIDRQLGSAPRGS
jgi:hypothetical protein